MRVQRADILCRDRQISAAQFDGRRLGEAGYENAARPEFFGRALYLPLQVRRLASTWGSEDVGFGAFCERFFLNHSYTPVLVKK
jgi:hypothetical protein